MIDPARNDLPAVAGGTPIFPEGLPLSRPSIADPERVARDVETIVASGLLTNGPYVRRLEARAAEYLGVRHCIAVASCTAGLMLVIRAADLTGEVIVPSFTFAATAHAVDWNGLLPVFADIDRDTLTLDPDSVQRAIGLRTSGIVATHVYGTPCDVEGLTAIADEHGLRLIFDAAHAFGSVHAGRRVGGFGDAEIFSLSPSKVLVAAEGGIIATDDDLLAERCRIGRDYGNPGDYDCRFVGLNARMSELHAATALASFDDLEERLTERNRLADLYHERLEAIPGVSFPRMPEGDRSTFKDLTAMVDPEAFGMSTPSLAAALLAEGVDSRRYYDPPVHRMRAYRGRARVVGDLVRTDWAADRVVSLPLWTGMRDAQVGGVAEALERIRAWEGPHPLRRDYAGNLRAMAHGPNGSST